MTEGHARSQEWVTLLRWAVLRDGAARPFFLRGGAARRPVGALALRTRLVFPGVAKHFRHPLQQLPADYAVRFHERAKIPVGYPVADKLAGGGDGRHARALVEQSDFAEIVALLQHRVLFAADENLGFAGRDD